MRVSLLTTHAAPMTASDQCANVTLDPRSPLRRAEQVQSVDLWRTSGSVRPRVAPPAVRRTTSGTWAWVRCWQRLRGAYASRCRAIRRGVLRKPSTRTRVGRAGMGKGWTSLEGCKARRGAWGLSGQAACVLCRVEHVSRASCACATVCEVVEWSRGTLHPPPPLRHSDRGEVIAPTTTGSHIQIAHCNL